MAVATVIPELYGETGNPTMADLPYLEGMDYRN